MRALGPSRCLLIASEPVDSTRTMAVTSLRSQSGPSRATGSQVRVYRRNVVGDRLRRGATWLLLNCRYAVMSIIGLGGRLQHLPRRSEVPLVAGLVFLWGLISCAWLVLGSYGIWWVVALAVTLSYFVGSYYLIMEYKGGEQFVGLALATDLILLGQSIVGQAIKLIIFTLFVLVCVRDWRRLVTLPERPKIERPAHGRSK